MHWHEFITHTNFSFLIGASHPSEIVETAISYDYSSLAITDYDGVYGIARAYRVLDKLKRTGTETDLKLHYGAEIHLATDHDWPICYQQTLVLLALNHEGYFNLCNLLTYAHRDGKHNANIPLEYLLEANVTNIVAVQPMRGLIRTTRDSSTSVEMTDFSRIAGSPQLYKYFDKLIAKFDKNFYFVVSKHLNPAEDYWIRPTYDLAKHYSAPILFSQDVFFHDKNSKRMSDIMHAIRHNNSVDNVSEQLFVNARRRMHSLTALGKIYSKLPQYKNILNNSMFLAERFNFNLDELTYQYPKEMIPEDHNAQSYLTYLAYKKAEEFYGSPLPDKVKKLIAHELVLVEKLKFADYFLTVYDIVSWARSQDILCQGRGSAANSAICFVLGITSVNPDNFDLLFERFISVERGDPPDIDVDFEHERREEVIQYIYRRYGRRRAAMVANVITFKLRGAIRFTGKALGIPDKLIDYAAKILDGRSFRWGHPRDTIVLLYKECKHLSEAKQLPEPLWKYWVEMATQIRGFPRHLGIHSGGFVVTEKNISWLCPQEPATMENRTVITWCKEDIEALGFFKIDILALGGLTLIRKCFELMKNKYGVDMTLATLPGDDPKTYEMIQRADTVGTFQIESRAQMSFLPRHKPLNFYDLVIQVAIIRPGPIQGGMIHPYIRRRRGEEPLTIPDPRLEAILKRTYGVPIFQEQVMRVAIAVGGFTAGEANELRKNIGAFTLNTDSDQWVGRLEDGMRKEGIDEKFINSIMGNIQGFSSYGFPESHAASFALLAYATAYLKCHYPTVFFTAILNSQPMGFYLPDTLLKTAINCGVKVLSICVNNSTWDHRMEWIASDNTDSPYALRLGFRLVKGLSKQGVEKLVKQRQSCSAGEEIVSEDRILQPWASLEEFLKQTNISRLDLTALAAANALSCFGVKRKDALWLAEAAPYKDWITVEESTVFFPRETELDSVQQDYEAAGVSLGKHPCQLIRQHAWGYDYPQQNLVLSNGVKKKQNVGKIIHVFGMVTCRQSPPTAKGMMFITLWDEYGSFDLVVRPNIFEKYRTIIDRDTFLLAAGIVQCDKDAYSILVRRFVGTNQESSVGRQVSEFYNRAESFKSTHHTLWY